jgi:hypothetical protein
MWKAFWKKWTIDKPALLGDWLWDVFVVRIAALLDRLTVRRMIALIPLAIVILAYCHHIPLPPELVFVGDLVAYIDIVAVLMIVSMLSRAATILFIIKQASARIGVMASRLIVEARRLDFRHRREGGSKGQKRLAAHAEADDDAPFALGGVAWA